MFIKRITFFILYFLKFVSNLKNITSVKKPTKQANVSATSYEDFVFSSNSIFFIETADRGLNYREACSIESAALAHPHRPINVLFTEPISNEQLYSKPAQMLSSYKNIKMHKINVTQYCNNTPLEKIFNGIRMRLSKYPVHHKSDVLRYLTLYKYGGIYSDLDVIMVKNLDTLPQKENWAGKESKSILSSSLMSIARKSYVGDLVINKCISILKKSFDPFTWSYNSNGVLRTAYQLASSFHNRDLPLGFKIYGKEYFHPISPTAAFEYFMPSKEPLKIRNRTFAFHIWNHQTENMTIYRTSIYAQLAKKFCPIINSAKTSEAKTLTLKREHTRPKTNYYIKWPTNYKELKFLKIANYGIKRNLTAKKGTSYEKYLEEVTDLLISKGIMKPSVKTDLIRRTMKRHTDRTV